jgi:hypothetical protein
MGNTIARVRFYAWFFAREAHQVARKPPSIGRAYPFSIAAASLSRKQTTDATSSHSAKRPNGIRRSIDPACSGSLHARFPMSVNTTSHVSQYNGRIDRINANAVSRPPKSWTSLLIRSTKDDSLVKVSSLAGGLANRINLVFSGLCRPEPKPRFGCAAS